MTILDEALPNVPPLLLVHVTETVAIRAALSLLDGVAELAATPTAGDWTLLALVDPAGDRQEAPAATALLVPLGPGTIELWAFGIRVGLPPAVVADRLVAATADWLRVAGWRRLAGPPPADVRPGLASALAAAGFSAQRTGGERPELSL